MKYTKLRKDILDATDDLRMAAVLSFIIDGAEIQKTDKPVIQQGFISKSLKLSVQDVKETVEELEDFGWFEVAQVCRETIGGMQYTSTEFRLSEQTLDYMNVKRLERPQPNKGRHTNLEGSLLFRDGKFYTYHINEGGDENCTWDEELVDVTNDVMASIGGVYASDI